MKKSLILLIILFSASTLFAESNCVKGICFEQTITINEKTYPLKNFTEYDRYYFEVYSTAIYSNNDNLKDLFAEPFLLDFQYERKITKEQLIKAAAKTLLKNPSWDPQKYAKQIGLINDKYETVTAGDTYALLFDPDIGMSLYRETDLLVEINDVEFAKLYFGIWLSEYSFSSKLTNALLR